MAVSKRTAFCQFGAEATAGTAVPADYRWDGPTTQEDGRVVTMVEQAMGEYADKGKSYIASLGLQGLTMESHPVTYEQLLHILEAGIDEYTPTSGNGAPYTSDYVLPAGAVDLTPKSYTIETGDATQAEEMAYCFVPSFELKGGADGALMLTAKWQGRQWASTTKTTPLSLPSSEEIILFNTAVLYIDDSGGTIGTTQVSNSFAEFSLQVDTGLRAYQTGDGQLYFTAVKRVYPKVTLSLTAEHDSTWDASGEVNDFRTQAVRLIQIKFTGTTNRVMKIDLAGKWTKFAYGDRDGNSVVTGELQACDSDSQFCSFNIVHNLAAVP
jgi:hypothetical protein